MSGKLMRVQSYLIMTVVLSLFMNGLGLVVLAQEDTGSQEKLETTQNQVTMTNETDDILPVTGSEFSISPLDYSITLTGRKSVVAEFKLVNQLEDDLGFKLTLDDASRADMAKYNLKLLVGEQKVDVSGKEMIIDVPAGETVTLPMQITPNLEKDFDIKIKLNLQQVESDRKLVQSDYELTLNLSSKLESTKKQFLMESVGVGGAIIVVIIISLFVLIKGNGKKSD